MANLIKSDASGFIAEGLSPFTIRQMSKIGMVTPSDETFEEAISNSTDVDAQLAAATQNNPVPLGIGDILGVPKFYPEAFSPSPLTQVSQTKSGGTSV